MTDHLPPTDHDGTAIDWDSERIQPPLSPELAHLAHWLGVCVASALVFAGWCWWTL